MFSFALAEKGKSHKVSRKKVAELMIIPWSFDLRVLIDRHILYLVGHKGTQYFLELFSFCKLH
jgi:hypothetical protein